jgi:DNA modification methylase
VRLLLQADARALPIASGAVSCVVTSPPYWGLRDYGHGDQLGLEPTPDAYVANLVRVFREVRRVLRQDGTAWLNLGDSYTSTAEGTVNAPQPKASLAHANQWARRRPFTGLKPKDLCGIPWRVAFALQADGWYLRSDIIWAKPNPMPESVTDRPTKAHEYVFLLTKAERYYYDAAAIAEGVAWPEERARVQFSARRAGAMNVEPSGNEAGKAYLRPDTRNRRSVWTVNTMPYAGAHFATMPEALAEPCILAGSRLGDVVLDPFCGSGTTVAVAERLGRHGVGVDLTYHGLAKERTAQRGLPLGTVGTEREYGVANGGESRRSVTNGSTAERTAEPAIQGRFH